jgi:hypothetical protein
MRASQTTTAAVDDVLRDTFTDGSETGLALTGFEIRHLINASLDLERAISKITSIHVSADTVDNNARNARN